MSWFTKYVEHPAMNALAQLESNPVIANNPDAASAVAQAKASATTVASTTTAAAGTVMASIEAQADPAVNALGAGLQAVVDAYLLATLGPVGAATAGLANTVIALGEDKAHSLLAALFGHAKSQVPVQAQPKAA